MRWTPSVCRAAALALTLAPAYAHSPHDVVLELGVSPAFAVDQTLFAAVTLTDNNIFVLSTDAGRSWTYVGTPMAAIAPRSFAFSPDFLSDRTAYAASASNGIWRTTDGGLSWHSCKVGLAGAVRDVAISPYFSSDHRLLAATDFGIYVSSNGGESWSQSNAGLTESQVLRVGLAPDGQGGLVAFATGSVFHISVDGGASWTAKGNFPKKVESLSISPNFPSDHRVAAAFGRYGQGVAVSQDGGQTFKFENLGLSDLFVEEVALANDGTMFAATDTAGCFRSAGPGQPWELKNKGFEQLSDLTFVHNTEVVPSPDFANDGLVFEGAYEGMYRSTNRGDDWWQLNVYSQLLQRRFVFSPQFATDRHILAGDYGGAVFHYFEQAPLPATGAMGGSAGGLLGGSSAGTQASGSAGLPGTQPGAAVPPWKWEALGTNLSSPWASVLAASSGQLGSRTLIYGYVGLYKSSNEGSTWVSANKPAPISVVRAVEFSPGFAADQTVFIGSGMEGAYRSTNGCQKWQELDGLPPFMLTSAIRISPGWVQDHTVFYASRNTGIWRSTDGGWQWSQVQNGLGTTNIKALGMSPAFAVDQTLLAGSYADGMWVSHDAGDSWMQTSRGLLASFSHMVESVAFSPDYEHDGTIYVALQNEGVWRTADFAESWQPTGTGLPGPPIDVSVSPTYALDGTLVVGTFGGTAISRDRGESWQPLPGYIRADDSHPSVRKQGTWSTVGAPADFCSTVTQTSAIGDWCELEFFGRNITWYCDQKVDGALARISLDGGAPTLIDTSSHVPHPQQPLFSADLGAPAWHVLRVEHGGGSGLRLLRSDGFAYEW
jgi:photosystem II stability/assembly factor-like uncharacterized protein